MFQLDCEAPAPKNQQAEPTGCCGKACPEAWTEGRGGAFSTPRAYNRHPKAAPSTACEGSWESTSTTTKDTSSDCTVASTDSSDFFDRVRARVGGTWATRSNKIGSGTHRGHSRNTTGSWYLRTIAINAIQTFIAKRAKPSSIPSFSPPESLGKSRKASNWPVRRLMWRSLQFYRQLQRPFRQLRRLRHYQLDTCSVDHNLYNHAYWSPPFDWTSEVTTCADGTDQPESGTGHEKAKTCGCDAAKGSSTSQISSQRQKGQA